MSFSKRTMELPDGFIRDHLERMKAPKPRDAARDAELKELIKRRLRAENAVLVAHYYVDGAVQAVAEETGGCVADSLEMARFGKDNPATTLVVAGVKFMGETAKILSPEKRVLMPTTEATCSLDITCPAAEFGAFCDQHPEREVVVYANTSAAVKARADWVVTSSMAYLLCDHLKKEGRKILFAPDWHLGSFIRKATGADMLLWEGHCIVHDEFKAQGIAELRREHPDAAVLAHPESPAAVLELADMVGSTSQIIAGAKTMPHTTFIVATDRGIFYRMGKEAPGKTFIAAPTGGQGATCQSCAHCPWMAMNELDNLATVFDRPGNEILVPPETSAQALVPLNRMLEFSAGRDLSGLNFKAI